MRIYLCIQIGTRIISLLSFFKSILETEGIYELLTDSSVTVIPLLAAKLFDAIHEMCTPPEHNRSYTPQAKPLTFACLILSR